MLARREPDRVIYLSRNDPEQDWYEYRNGPAAPEEGYLQRYLAALYRYRWLALGVFALVVAGALAYLFVATPVYEADVHVLIEPDTPNVVSFKEVIDEDPTKLEYYQTQMQILRSRSLARKTLDTLDLWNDAEISGQTGGVEGLVRDLRLAVAAVRLRATHLLHKPDVLPPGATESAAQSRAIDQFLSRLVLNYRADNRILEVGFQSIDPRKAATIANAIVHTYMDESLDVKLRAAKAASDWLNTQIAQQRAQVQASEAAVQRYRQANGDVAIPPELADLNTAVTHAQTERLQTEALYRQLQAVQDNPAALDTVPVILSNDYIQKLKAQLADLQGQEAKMAERLGDRHPDLVNLRTAIRHVQQQIQAEVTRVVESVGNQYRTARAQERSLVAALDRQKRDTLTADGRAIQYNELQREAASNRAVYEALLQRAKETGISSELKTSNVRIVDPAEIPLTPSSPRTLPILLFALVIGIPLGGVAAIGRELLDDRIKSPDEIKNLLGLKFLGFAPAVRASQFAGYGPLINGAVPSLFAEAFRTVRANVLLAVPAPGTKVLLVTSTGPSEGKTLVASNLAVSLAQGGRRVLLVDGDLRLSKVHEVFKEPLGRGLAEVLAGRMKMRDVVRSTVTSGLSIVTAGTTPERPGDLMEARRFQEAITSLDGQFDWIVLDSPPVLAVSDAVAMVPSATGVVFVVGSQMPRKRSVEAALEQLDAADAKMVGVVLSRADVQQHSSYYNSSYLRYHAPRSVARS